jgi:predicted dehydrogenase
MTVRVGLAGVAHGHAWSYLAGLQALPGVSVRALYDDDVTRGEAAAARTGIPFVSDYATFLGTGLDAVVVASENARHRALTEAAAARGCHVLCEKPLATTLADARAMVEACRRAGVLLATAFPVRFVPAMTEARAILQSGAIGEVLGIRGTNRGTMPGGWFVDPALSGGGAVIDHTVHVVDLVRWMLGQEVVDVAARLATRFHPIPVEDTGLLLLRWAGGAVMSLDTSWSRPRSFPTWGDVTLEFVGTDGVLAVDAFRSRVVVYRDDMGKAVYQDYGPSMNDRLVAAFVQAVQGDTVEIPTGDDGLRATAVALAAYRSAAVGQPVPVDGE